MGQLDDLKEKLRTEATQVWEKFQESTAYRNASDRFENLSPLMQKLVLVGAAVGLLALVLSFPLSSFWSGSDSLSTYESQKDLIHDLFKVSQDTQTAMGMSPAPASDVLKSRVDDSIKAANLLPEQINEVTLGEIPPGIPKESFESGLKVALKKLNLRQIVDIGYDISNLHPAIKMIDLSMQANAQDSRYFDVIYRLATLKIPVYIPPLPDEDSSKKEKKSSKPPKPIKDSKEDDQ